MNNLNSGLRVLLVTSFKLSSSPFSYAAAAAAKKKKSMRVGGVSVKRLSEKPLPHVKQTKLPHST